MIELRIKTLTRAVTYLLSNTKTLYGCAEASGCKRVVKAQSCACIERPFTQKACSRMKRRHAFCGRGGCLALSELAMLSNSCKCLALELNNAFFKHTICTI